MKQRVLQAFLATVLYLTVANAGNFLFGINRRFNWTITLWESLFFFLFIFLLLGYRKNKK